MCETGLSRLRGMTREISVPWPGGLGGEKFPWMDFRRSRMLARPRPVRFGFRAASGSMSRPRPLSLMMILNSFALAEMAMTISVAPECFKALFNASLTVRNRLCRTSVERLQGGNFNGILNLHCTELLAVNSL